MGFFPMWIVLFFLTSSLFFGAGLIATCLAWKKGYRPWFWLISMGPIGLGLMLVKPNLSRATTPEQREQWEASADWMGGVLSGLSLFFLLAFPLLMMGFFVGLARAPIAPAPVILPPAASSTVETNGDATPVVEESGAEPVSK